MHIPLTFNLYVSLLLDRLDSLTLWWGQWWSPSQSSSTSPNSWWLSTQTSKHVINKSHWMECPQQLIFQVFLESTAPSDSELYVQGPITVLRPQLIVHFIIISTSSWLFCFLFFFICLFFFHYLCLLFLFLLSRTTFVGHAKDGILGMSSGCANQNAVGWLYGSKCPGSGTWKKKKKKKKKLQSNCSSTATFHFTFILSLPFVLLPDAPILLHTTQIPPNTKRLTTLKKSISLWKLWGGRGYLCLIVYISIQCAYDQLLMSNDKQR